MDLKQFEAEVRDCIGKLNYVSKIEIKQRTEISLQGTINFQNGYQLRVFYNEAFSVISFSLLIKNKRIWAIDRDNRISWHTHTYPSPNEHLLISEMTIDEIIITMDDVYRRVCMLK